MPSHVYNHFLFNVEQSYTFLKTAVKPTIRTADNAGNWSDDAVKVRRVQVAPASLHCHVGGSDLRCHR